MAAKEAEDFVSQLAMEDSSATDAGALQLNAAWVEATRKQEHKLRKEAEEAAAAAGAGDTPSQPAVAA